MKHRPRKPDNANDRKPVKGLTPPPGFRAKDTDRQKKSALRLVSPPELPVDDRKRRGARKSGNSDRKTGSVSELTRIEIELRLSRVLLDGSPALRQMVIDRVPVEAIINMPDAWAWVVDRIKSGKPVKHDVLRLCNRFDVLQRGYINSLPNVPLYDNPDDLNDLIGWVMEDYNRLRILNELRPTVKALNDEDITPDEAVADIQTTTLRLSERIHTHNNRAGLGTGFLFKNVFDDLRNDRTIIAPTGFSGFDDRFGGLTDGELVVINAKTNTGKSAVMLQMGQNAAIQGCPIGYISLEMGRVELWKRLISNQASVPFTSLRKWRKLAPDQQQLCRKALRRFHDRLKEQNSRFIINDDPGITIAQIGSEVATYGLKIVYVDYLGLIAEGEGERWERLGQLAMGLKRLARQANIAVVVAVQKDLDSGRIRYSREIGEHADIVFTWEFAPVLDVTEYTFPIEVSKGRGIPCFSFPVHADFNYMRIVDIPVTATIGIRSAATRAAAPADDPEEPITVSDLKDLP